MELESILGKDKFHEVYRFLKDVHLNLRFSQPNQQRQLREKLARIVGKENLSVCGDVDQLLYIEEMKNRYQRSY